MRRSFHIPAFFICTLCAVLAACSDDEDPTGPEPVGPITYADDIQPIFTARCAVAGCHAPPTSRANLDLSAGVSWANIVGVPTEVFVPGVRVTPFEPDSSVLYLLVRDGDMPQTGPGLTTTQVDGIRTWILDGAPDN